VISNLMGDLECNLVVTFGAVSNSKAGKFHVPFQHFVVSPRYISHFMLIFFLYGS